MSARVRCLCPMLVLAILGAAACCAPGCVAGQPPPDLPVGAAPARPPLGTNVSGMDDWSTEFTFLDAFKNSRRFFSGTARVWQDTQPLDLDARGWVRSLRPGQWARALMYWDLSRTPGRYPAGRYVVTYDGQGTLAYAPSARRVETAPGREVIDVDPNRGGGIGLFITATNPANYLRNIRVRLLSTATAGEVFYPAFLEKIRRYRVIRFMNWMLGQNNNQIQQSRWSDRPQVGDATYSVRGVPVEVMCQLCNRLGADPWFNISHLADDDYVRQFALTARQYLDPERRIYVEHSNEVWNGQYPQARYAQQQGLAMGLSTNPYQAQIFYHALRSRQIFGIFEGVFSPERLVRVLASFHANPWTSQQMLQFGDTRAHTDALAIAPYFSAWTNEQERTVTLSLDQLMQELETRWLPVTNDFTRQHVAIASRAGLPVIAYEGGQHLVGVGAFQRNPTLNALYDAANRDPRMGALYSRYLQDWTDAGGQLFVHLTNCGAAGIYGRFGSLEYIDQPRETAPKYDALQRFIEGG